ncbi:hypothetical protein D3C78_1244200 [compost metagenome]
MPKLSIDPGHARDEAVGLDGAQDPAVGGVDLQDLARLVLTDPERSFGPRQAGIITAVGGRNRRQYLTGAWIDLADAVAGDLE